MTKKRPSGDQTTGGKQQKTPEKRAGATRRTTTAHLVEVKSQSRV